MVLWRTIGGTCLCLSLVAGLGRAQEEEDEFLCLGPLYQEFRLTLENGRRTEALGPLFYWEQREESKTWAVPPVLAHEWREDLEVTRLDVLWKLAAYSQSGPEWRFQLLRLFSLAGGGTQSGTNVHRVTLFPLYFHQWSDLPEQNYWALIPVYGTLKNRLFRDEIRFALFPLYSRTRKKDVVTDNYLYPLFHRRHGEGLRGWQVWPLVGIEHKDLTWQTNQWGEAQPSGGHDKVFGLWPVFFRQCTGLGTTNQAHQTAVLPFYSLQHSATRRAETFLWPLGLTHIHDEQRQYEEWQALYPLVVFAHGPGKTTRRVFPFFSHAHNTNLTSDWYLWPLYKYRRAESPAFTRERTRWLLFLYSDTRATAQEEGAETRRVDLWPLFSWRRDEQGRSRLQALSLLEPLLPGNRSVERDLSPLWSLWRSEHNHATGARSQSLLWNLYRREATPTRRKCSLLFGLFQYERGPAGRRWRLFYLPIASRSGPPAGS